MMMKLTGTHFAEILNAYKSIATAATNIAGDHEKLEPSASDLIKRLLEGHEGWAEAAGLQVTLGLITKLRIELALFDLTSGQLKERLRQIDDAFQIEIGAHVFLYMNQSTAHFLDKQNGFGDHVSEAFPSISYDVGEACTCLALQRGTACVFHLMRVLTPVFECVARTLGFAETSNSWGSYLMEMSKANRRANPNKNSENFLFFAALEAQLWAIKNGWRDDALHSVASKYTEGEAEGIFRAVEGLVRKAATKLKETQVAL